MTPPPDARANECAAPPSVVPSDADEFMDACEDLSRAVPTDECGADESDAVRRGTRVRQPTDRLFGGVSDDVLDEILEL